MIVLHEAWRFPPLCDFKLSWAAHLNRVFPFLFRVHNMASAFRGRSLLLFYSSFKADKSKGVSWNLTLDSLSLARLENCQSSLDPPGVGRSEYVHSIHHSY